MPLWHPVVQLFFCVSRMVQGVVFILTLVVWVKLSCCCYGLIIIIMRGCFIQGGRISVGLHQCFYIYCDGLAAAGLEVKQNAEQIEGNDKIHATQPVGCTTSAPFDASNLFISLFSVSCGGAITAVAVDVSTGTTGVGVVLSI